MHDALAAFDGPIIEVHISNPNAREPWRHTSVVAPVATGSIVGLGMHGYELAVRGRRRQAEPRRDAAARRRRSSAQRVRARLDRRRGAARQRPHQHPLAHRLHRFERLGGARPRRADPRHRRPLRRAGQRTDGSGRCRRARCWSAPPGAATLDAHRREPCAPFAPIGFEAAHVTLRSSTQRGHGALHSRRWCPRPAWSRRSVDARTPARSSAMAEACRIADEALAEVAPRSATVSPRRRCATDLEIRDARAGCRRPQLRDDRGHRSDQRGAAAPPADRHADRGRATPSSSTSARSSTATTAT